MKIFILPIFIYSSFCFASIKLEGTYSFPKKTTHLAIYKSGEFYEGKISWVQDNKLDSKNPDPQLRNRTIENLVILKNLKQTDENIYSGGEAYDPETGNTYRCKVWFENNNANKLFVRGYIGIPLLGRSSELTRIESK